MKKHLMFALALFSVVLMGTQKASAGDPSVYTSNVELTTEGGSSVWNDGDVIINDVNYPAIKMGTSSKSGVWKLTVPAGTEELSFYAVSWKGKSCTLTIEGATADPNSIALTSNDGASNNGPYTIVPNAETEFYTIALSGVKVDTELTFSTDQRCIIWGVNAAAAEVSYTLAAEPTKPEAGKAYAIIAWDYNNSVVGNYIMYEESNYYRNISVKTFSEVTADMVWYFMENGDGVAVRNVGSGNYVTGYPTSSAEFFTTPDTKPATFYVQNSLGEGFYSLNLVKDGTGNTAWHHKSNDRVVCWNTNADASNFAFYEVQIPDDKKAKFDEYEALKDNKALLNEALAEAKAKLYKDVTISADGATAIALQKDDAAAVGFVSCSYPDSNEGKDLSYMWDNNGGTFFHSTYRLTTTNDHYLEVNVPAGTKAFTFNYVTRAANTNVMPNYIVVSCVDANGNVIAATELTEGFPYTQNTNGEYTSPVIVAAKGTAKVRVAFHTTETHHAFALAEFGVSVVPAANVEGVTPADAALAALVSEAEAVLAKKGATADEVKAAYIKLKSAIVEHPNYPFVISTDDDPAPYVIKSGRADNPVYTLTDEGYIHLNAYTGDINQAWCFYEIQDENLNYVLQLVPYGQPKKAMAYTQTGNSPKLVFLADKDDTSVYTTWTPASTNGAAPYGLQPTANKSTYLSNNGGVNNDMGFWTGSPSGDGGTAQYYEAYDVTNIKLAVGKYFMRNKANGKYIANGDSWATRATFTSNFGIEFNVTANENGTYKLGTFVNNGKSLRDSDGFTDQDGNWTIEATNKFNTFTVKGSAGYLGSDGSEVVAVALAEASEAAQWEFITKEQLIEEALAAEASAENPVDISFLITGRSFLKEDGANNAAWTPNAPGTGGKGGSGNAVINTWCGEFWNKTVVKAAQTFTGLPDGYYRFDAFAYYRMGGPADHANHMQAGDLKQNAYMFINDTKQPVKFVSDEAKDASVDGWPTAYTAADGTVMMYGPNALEHSVLAFTAGAYKNSLIAHVVGGTLTLGFVKDDYVAEDWFVFDEAQLFYLGNTPTGDVEPGTYYLYNKESGKFLSRGAAWGTQICLDYYGYAFNVLNEGEAHILKVIDWQEGGNNVSLLNGDDGGSFVDNTSTTENKHTFKAVEGGYKISNNANGEYWIVNDPSVNTGIGPHGSEADALVFDFITPAEYESLIAQRWADEQLAAAKKANVAATTEALIDTLAVWSKVDETSNVKNASLIGSRDGWTWTAGRYRGGSLTTNENGTECYQGTGTLYQKVEGLTPGFYKVTLNGFYRSMGDRIACYNYSQEGIHLSSAYVMANGNVTRIKAVGDDAVINGETIYPNWMNESKDCFAKGLYLNEVYTYVGEDGVLEISINQPSWKGECWLMMNNVTVTRYIADPYAPLRSALSSAAKIDVDADAMQAAVAAEFKAAVAQGQADLDKNQAAVAADTERILAAIDAVKASVATYKAIEEKIENGEYIYVEGCGFATEFKTVVDAVKKAYFDRAAGAEELAAITEAYQTYLAANEITIPNPSFDEGLEGWDTYSDSNAWGHDHWQAQGASYSNGDVRIEGFIESWGANASMGKTYARQTIAAVPAGKYMLAMDLVATVQGVDNNKEAVTEAYIFINEDSLAVATGNGEPEHFEMVADLPAGSVTYGYATAPTSTVTWEGIDNVKFYSFNPEYAILAKLEEAKALVAANPDVNGEPLSHIVAEIKAANSVDGLKEAIEFFKSAIDVYTKFAALYRQYGEVEMLAAANKEAAKVLFSATIPLEQVYPAYEAYKEAVYEYCMGKASVDEPVDVTEKYVVNPSFETGDLTGWTIADTAGDQGVYPITNGTYTMNPCDGLYVFNSWNGDDTSYTLSQTIDLPAGFYKLTAVVATHQGHEVTVFAGDKTTTVANTETDHTVTYPAEIYFTHEGGALNIGVLGGWFYKVDDFRIWNLGNQKVLGYFTMAKSMAEGAEEDPIYKMLAADPKFKTVYNEVDADFDGSLEDYDAIVVQESFGGANSTVTKGALSIYEVKRPTLFNKTYALGSKRGTEHGTRADAQGDYFVTVYNNVSKIFSGIEGEDVRVFFDGATDTGAAGTKALSYVYGNVAVPEGSLIAAPSTVSNAAIAISDFHADENIDGKAPQARIITFNMNYGALCREGGKYLTDAGYTMWRNAAYLLLGLRVPETMVNMEVNDVCEVAGVTLDVTATEVGEDQTVTLNATVLPETAADKALVWTSSDENIATVADGVVTGVNKGECDITVATVDGGYTASCHITVFRTRFYTYDFREWSTETEENMAADAKKKTNWQKLGSYYKTTGALTGEGLTTADGDIAEAKGLLFTAGSGNLRVYFGETDDENYILFFAAGSVVVPTVLYDQVTVCVNGVATTYTAAGTTFEISLAKGDILNWIQVDPCGEGIESMTLESDVIESAIYSVDGKKLAQPAQGVNIIKKTHADGTVTSEKVLVK